MKMQIEEFLEDLERRVANILKIGTVIEIKEQKVKVKCGDITTKFLPLITPRAADCIVYFSPQIDEQVLILSPCGELNNGIVLPAIYTKYQQRESEQKHTIEYADGTIFSYDYENKLLDIKAVGDISITAENLKLEQNKNIFLKAQNIEIQTDEDLKIATKNIKISANDNIEINAEKVKINADLEVAGSINATEDIKSSNISLQNHTHIDAKSRTTSSSK